MVTYNDIFLTSISPLLRCFDVRSSSIQEVLLECHWMTTAQCVNEIWHGTDAWWIDFKVCSDLKRVFWKTCVTEYLWAWAPEYMYVWVSGVRVHVCLSIYEREYLKVTVLWDCCAIRPLSFKGIEFWAKTFLKFGLYRKTGCEFIPLWRTVWCHFDIA